MTLAPSMRRPPDDAIERIARDLKQYARGNFAAGEALDGFESRFGDINGHLKSLEWEAHDMAVMLKPVKNRQSGEVTYQPCVHNMGTGQLVTALERGLLPLAPEVYKTAVETAEERMNSGERAARVELQEKPEAPLLPFKCKSCGRSMKTERRLRKHIYNYHGEQT